QELLLRVDTQNFAGGSPRVRRAGLSQSRRNAAVALSARQQRCRTPRGGGNKRKARTSIQLKLCRWEAVTSQVERKCLDVRSVQSTATEKISWAGKSERC